MDRCDEVRRLQELVSIIIPDDSDDSRFSISISISMVLRTEVIQMYPGKSRKGTINPPIKAK